MEEAPRIRLYVNARLSGDGDVKASFGLGAECIYVARILSHNGMNSYGQTSELELGGSAHHRTADRKTGGTVDDESDSSPRRFRRSDVCCEAHGTTGNRTVSNLHAGGGQSKGCWHRPATSSSRSSR